jgi:hypothetical protein
MLDVAASPDRYRRIASETWARDEVEETGAIFRCAELSYAERIDRAAMILVAMSFRSELKPALIEEIAAAVEARGGRTEDDWFVRFDLRIVTEGIVERTMTILSAALRERLPGIADEIDESFGDNLRILLGTIADVFPTLGH